MESATAQRLDALLGPTTPRANAAEALARYRQLGQGSGDGSSSSAAAAAAAAAAAKAPFADDPLVVAWREAVEKARVVTAAGPGVW